jgi:hypothetical protein
LTYAPPQRVARPGGTDGSNSQRTRKGDKPADRVTRFDVALNVNTATLLMQLVARRQKTTAPLSQIACRSVKDRFGSKGAKPKGQPLRQVHPESRRLCCPTASAASGPHCELAWQAERLKS